MLHRISARFSQPKMAWGLVLCVFVIFFAIQLGTSSHFSRAFAEVVSLSEREKVLTITVYNYSEGLENSRQIEFGIRDLEVFPLVSVGTETPWTNGILHFKGPLLRDILRDAGAIGNIIQVGGLDGRSAIIPREDIETYDVIVACQINGEYFGLRDRGPLWIIYPWSENSEIQTATFYERGIYHLGFLSVESR